MSDSSTNKPIIPSITGIPVLDTMLGAALISVSTALATTAVTWMNAHGFQGYDATQVSSAILGILVLVATITWRYMSVQKTKTAVADHVITAAATGQIPDSVLKEAVKAPAISDAKIEQAMQNAEVIKEKQ